MKRAFGWLKMIVVVCFGLGFCQSVEARPVIVFAAASLKTALDDIATRWQRQTGQVVRVSYAGTPTLARQIEQGAPADLFISADVDWMQYLADRHLVGVPQTLLGNRLALVAPRESELQLHLTRNAPLVEALHGGRLAVANVRSVPAGRYAKAALQALGLWDSVSGRLAQASNVRAALRLVARGEAPLGIVYATDAHAEPAVRIVDVFDETAHPPIEYLAAPVAGRENNSVREFLRHLTSSAAASIFEREGFIVPATTVGQ